MIGTRVFLGEVRILKLPNLLWFCRILPVVPGCIDRDLYRGPCRPTFEEARRDAAVWLMQDGLVHPLTHDLQAQPQTD